MQNGVGDMILEARSPNCFSRVYVLKMQGRPIGEFEGRWFSEGMDIRLIKRRRLHLEKTSMFGSQFTLTDQGGCGSEFSPPQRFLHIGMGSSTLGRICPTGLGRIIQYRIPSRPESKNHRRSWTHRVLRGWLVC